MCIPFFCCCLLDVYIDFTPASSDWTSPGLHSTAPFLARCSHGCTSSSYPQSWASSWCSSSLNWNQISAVSTSSWMIKWSVSRQWCKCLVVPIKRAIFSWIPILSLPCPFSQQIQYLKSVAEKQTLAVCAFMTPETVEPCQTGMIL
jgi:hypothetical protein